MNRIQRRFMTTVLVIVMSVIPVVISSDDGSLFESGLKMPEITTMGPAPQPYQLTAAEKEKLALLVTTEPAPTHVRRPAAERATQPSYGPYEGITAAERDKLTRWRETQKDLDVPAPKRPDQQPARFEIVPRARGIEGMTPEERAKLEAYLNANR